MVVVVNLDVEIDIRLLRRRAGRTAIDIDVTTGIECYIGIIIVGGTLSIKRTNLILIPSHVSHHRPVPDQQHARTREREITGQVTRDIDPPLTLVQEGRIDLAG